jgi:DNA replication protein DnaC
MTQKEAMEILKMGYNCYVTGAAGSGKTHLLNEPALRRRTWAA